MNIFFFNLNLIRAKDGGKNFVCTTQLAVEDDSLESWQPLTSAFTAHI